MNLEYPWDDERLKYKNIQLYKSKEKDRYLLIGNNPMIQQFSIIHLNIQKGDQYSKPLKQVVQEDDRNYETLEEAKTALLKTHKDLSFMYEIKGIIGFIKFLFGYYVIFVRAIQPRAKLGKHKIFTIDRTCMLELFEMSNANEQKYKNLINEYDLEIGFYSSYTYDITSSLNKNLFPFNKNQIPRDRKLYQIGQYRNVFLWNHFVLQEFDQIIKNKRWILPIIHGYCEQSTIKTITNYFSICIIARRSINHAGARYLTRGINEQGFVANFVETEQIVIELDKSTPQRPACSSFIQIRGSAPVYWYQEPNLLVPKPPIIIHQSDPYLMATRKHISDLICSYGKYIFMVNLVKANEHNPREQILADEFDQSIKIVKEELQNQNEIEVGYLHFDMKAQLKADKEDFVSKCYSLAHWCLMRTGVFLFVKEPKCNQNVIVEVQNGVVRSNCIDCLDRTNTFQQLIGEMALGIQLAKINQTSLKFNLIEVNDQVFQEYREMYEQLGDFISLQYGSSLAHKQNIGQSSKRFELYTSFKRHIQNNTSDKKKQYQIDLFLGIRLPDPEEPLIWETTAQVTLFPDVKYLQQFLNEANWWLRPYMEFLEKCNYNELSRLCLMKGEIQKSQSIGIRKLQKKMTFNFDIIERMTQKGQANKVKSQNKCVFVIEAPYVKLREKLVPHMTYNIEDTLKKAYNDIVFLNYDEPQKEQSLEIELISQRTISITEQSPLKQKYPHMDKEEQLLYKEYLRVKSYDELMSQAREIEKFIFRELEDSEEQHLREQIKDYLDGKPSIQQHSNKHDTIIEDNSPKKSFYNQIEVKSSIIQSESNTQVIQSINVHQPKKITIEQKSVKFLESLLKKNISATQRLKINKI